MKDMFLSYINNPSNKKLGESFFKGLAKSDSAFSGKNIRNKTEQVIKGTTKEYTGYYVRKGLKKTFVNLMGGKGSPLANAMADQMTRLFAVPMRNSIMDVSSHFLNKKGSSGKSIIDAYDSKIDAMTKSIDGMRSKIVKHGEDNGFLKKGSYDLYNSDRRKAREEFTNLYNQAHGDKQKHNETRNALWKDHKKEVATKAAELDRLVGEGKLGAEGKAKALESFKKNTRYSKYKKSLRHRIDVRYERNKPKTGATFHSKYTDPNYYNNKYLHSVKPRDPFHIKPK